MRRRVLLALLLLAGLAVGARILMQATVEPDAVLGRAQAALAADQLDEAAALARAVLAARPLDGRAYRVLAQRALKRGDGAQLATFTALAVQYAPRDLEARALAAQLAIEAADFGAAVDHYDRMLRVEPASAERVFPVLAGLAQTDGGRERLLLRLAERPLWRLALLRHAARALPAAADLPPLFHALGRRAGLSPEEMAAYIGRFVDDRQWQAAYLAWLNELPQARLGQLASPVNGNFELSSTGAPFEWLIEGASGAEAGIADRDDGAGHALHVAFAGARAQVRNVRQLLLLQPGLNYLLHWQSRLDALDTPRGLHWVLVCAQGGGERLLNGELLQGSAPWRRHEQGFTVPPGCPAQWLQLELDARIAAETYARGAAWFDDVVILAADVASR